MVQVVLYPVVLHDKWQNPDPTLSLVIEKDNPNSSNVCCDQVNRFREYLKMKCTSIHRVAFAETFGELSGSF